jgi:sodium transport system ATP-binding protein
MIEVERLTKRFPLPDGGETTAVDGVTFQVAPGEVYGLLGPNGAGKTTTIRMILGLLSATAGYASIAGFRSSEHPEEVKRRVGVVSANAGVYHALTVKEMLLFFADVYGVPPDAAREEMNRLAKLFGFADLLDRYCGTLSTGQRQRLHLARAMIHQPDVLLLDEPTVGVDVLGSQVVVEFVDLLRRQGKAVIFCTHRLEEAEYLCTRVGLLHRGRLVSEGTIPELQARTGKERLVDMFLALAGVGRLLDSRLGAELA